MPDKMSVDQQLFAITTIIETQYAIRNGFASAQATGFFFNETTSNPTDGPEGHWERFDKFWLVTNRHVVFNTIGDVECLAHNLTFNLRKEHNGSIEWVPITLSKDELRRSLLLHRNIDVDVVAIDVSEYIMQKITQDDEEIKNIIIPVTLTQDNLPNNQPISIEVTSDIIVASYPRGFYDIYNKFPIIKSGIIASCWGGNFNGKPIFQIDAQLFPGSSGGLVISKPTNITVHNGELMYRDGSKEFILLGVYSGEYQWTDSMTGQQHSYGLGNVWYSSLITEIIKEGEKHMEN